MNTRFDFGFSYWIFVWYILYKCKITSYNPKIALIIGLFENILVLFAMLYYNNKILYIFVFVIINILIKLIPLWTLRNTSYKWVDFYAAFLLFIIFSIWLNINDVNFIQLENEMYYEIKKGNPSGPITYYVIKYA